MKNKNRSFSRAEITPELVERARGGDQAPCAALYEQINPALYRTVRAMIRDEDLAWDVLQNSWLRAFRSLDQLEANEAFLPWLRRIAVNEAVRQVARRQPASFTELGTARTRRGSNCPIPIRRSSRSWPWTGRRRPGWYGRSWPSCRSSSSSSSACGIMKI